MSMDLKKTIIDTLRTIGYTKIMKESITTKDILGMVSANKGVPVSEIKVLVDYKTIIKDEIAKMKNEAKSKKTLLKQKSDDKLIDMNDIDELPDTRFRDILRPGQGGAPVPIADWLTTKDLANLSIVNKATRESAILELKRKQGLLILDYDKTAKYMIKLKYRTRINSILSKYNKKLHLSIYKDQKLFDILWTIPEIEINLQSLELAYLKKLTDIKSIEKLTNLQSLVLQLLENLTDIKPLEKLTKLQSLNLEYIYELTNITPLEKLTNLKSLKLRSLFILTDIKPLEKLTNLQNLELIFLPELTDVKSIEKLINLQSLSLNSLRIKDIKSIEKLTNLQSLELNNLRKCNIKPVEKLTNLQNLELLYLECLTNIKPIEKLKKLKSLKLVDLMQITDYSSVDKLEKRGVKIITALSDIDIDRYYLEDEDEEENENETKDEDD